MLNLITDRTVRDVARLKELNSKGWVNMSDAEKTEWNTVSKGAYNCTDLTRVQAAVTYLSLLFAQYGYAVELLDMRTWTATDVPTLEELTSYLENVRRIRNAFFTLTTTPQLPASMRGLTYAGANAIEQTLVDVEMLMGNMISSQIRCGEVFGGEYL